VFRGLKAVANHQYGLADTIGVQNSASVPFFEPIARQAGISVEVLENWLSDAPNVGTKISIANTRLAGRKIFVYAGNMGVAQEASILLGLSDRMRDRKDVGFLFVGRGTDMEKLQSEARARNLDNVVFHDEIDSSEIPGLFAQCHAGILTLNPRHKTHNTPGKFLSYLRAGLPVLASINPGNDLCGLIERAGVGRVISDSSLASLEAAARSLLDEISISNNFASQCRALWKSKFSTEAAARQIISRV
jgi:glycosyltransferase involved in cell wall biosynthesis